MDWSSRHVAESGDRVGIPSCRPGDIQVRCIEVVGRPCSIDVSERNDGFNVGQSSEGRCRPG